MHWETIVAVLALAAWPGAGADGPPAGVEKGGELAVGVLSSWERALRSDPPGAKRAVELHAARNEWESFQIAVRSSEPVRLLGVNVAPLAGPGGAEIPEDCVRRYRAHQLHVREGTHRNAAFRPGWYPDALVPFPPTSGTGASASPPLTAVPFDLPKGETHTFWIDVYVPEDAPAGDYTSEISISAENRPVVEVPLSVRVWPFTLPRRPTLRTEFGSPAPRILRWYRERLERGEIASLPDRDAVEEECARVLREHRLNCPPPGGLVRAEPGEDGAFRLSDAEIEGLRRFVATQNVNAISVPSPSRLFKDPVADRERAIRYVKSWDAVLDAIEEPELLLYTYLIDEPNDEGAYEFTRTWGRLIRDARSRVRVLVTEQTKTQDASWGDLHGAVDIWVPLFSLFDPDGARARRAAGESVWTYTALCQGKPTPWWHIDYPLYHYRIPCWMAWLHHMEGLLYWGGLSYWRAVEDPWTDPATYPPKERRGKVVYNGEGTLLYPGNAVGRAAAVPSMRLKALRDGIEDFDYLALLESTGRRPVAEALLRSAVQGWYEWTTSEDLYAQVRRKLGCLISNAPSHLETR